MTALTALVLVPAALLLAVLAAGRLLDLVARIGRFRRYRRAYPSADSGRVWRHVR